mgnify:CR=1 FL=1
MQIQKLMQPTNKNEILKNWKNSSQKSCGSVIYATRFYFIEVSKKQKSQKKKIVFQESAICWDVLQNQGKFCRNNLRPVFLLNSDSLRQNNQDGFINP